MSSTKNKVVGIAGYGEIGKSVGKCYKKKRKPFLIRDVDVDEIKDTQLDVLHICIPGNIPDFVKIVKDMIRKNAKDAIVIIHSTVPIGTTENIGKSHVFVAHSPVRGVHPNLCDGGLLNFVSYVGADHSGTARLVCEHLETLGIECEAVRGSRNTEAGKLWSTTAYGWSIILEKMIHRFCEDNNLNYDIVYKDFTDTYNQGYWKLDRGDVIRPSLTHMEGGIGGHCIVPNCEMLGGEVPDFILEQNETF